MWSLQTPPAFSDLDRQVFDALVPENHYLRAVEARIDFERFRPLLNEAYKPQMGRPPVDVVRMLKIEFLRFHYRLSDRQAMERSKTDVAFRWFLGLGSHQPPPDHTTGTYFRQRIGAERFKKVFQELVAMAREYGLVRDRLRLKDATHLYADAADLTPLRLTAQVRERLLRAAEPFFPDWTAEQRVGIEALRATTAEAPDEERLAARVEHLRGMAAQLRERVARLPPTEEPGRSRRRLNRMLELVDKLLEDRTDPDAQDRLASDVDPDARVGKHGRFFVGYLLDVMMDAESEIVTAVEVLPGNGAEAADAVALVEQERAAQGNQVAEVSIDGAGYNGPVLRTLTDPAGLNLEVVVPPPSPRPRSTFGPERFTLQVIDERTCELTCPNGETTRRRERIERDTGYKYLFRAGKCAGCPLREQCLEKPASKRGRTVIKNDYEAEYRRVQAKAATPEYEQARAVHPRIERKLGELARHHGCRRARYRGLEKVRVQAFMTALAVNVKRIVKLAGRKLLDGAGALAVRAELKPA